MTLYADLPVRRAFQIAGDLLLIAWICGWIVLARTLHAATLELRAPGYQMDASATDLADRLRDAGETVGGIPLVGDDVQAPFDGAGGAAEGLASAGRSQVAAVESLAFWLALAVALIPILLVLVIYLPARIRFAVRATAGRRFLDSGADLDLFALRALARLPVRTLARIDEDPAGAWRRQEAETVDRLAELELRSVGLRVPRRLTSASD